MDLGDNPITLVVKAPNQKISDQTVDCMIGWTVWKLKQHLANVYPSKPSENHQKLIYSGRLLSDHLTLKEVLRQYEQGNHTVHLVCAPSHSESKLTSTCNESSDLVQDSASSENVPNTDSELRQRNHVTSSGGLQNQSVTSPVMNQYPPPYMTPMVGMPPTGFMYTPEHYAWMQQMYAQYMAQYMQYYQTGATPTSVHTTPSSGLTNQPEPNNQDNARPVNQNVVMNAQGGAMLDDEEDFDHRDWLDWVYVISRLGILLSVIYFYSTLWRFLMVFLCVILIYIHKAGWFQVRIRQPREVENNDQQPAEQQHVNQQQQQQPQESVSDEQSPSSEPAAEDDQEVSGEPSTQVVHNSPGVIYLVWSFVKSFFTSLIPQAPPAVNAN